MDTLITLDSDSWALQDSIQRKVVDILHRNQIIREVRAFDCEIRIRHTTDAEHDTIAENVAISIPLRHIVAIRQTCRYDLSSDDRDSHTERF